MPLPNLGHLCLVCLVQVRTCFRFRSSHRPVYDYFKAKAPHLKFAGPHKFWVLACNSLSCTDHQQKEKFLV